MTHCQPYQNYKPSCVDWLGEIPAHWHIKRLKFSTNLINNKVNVEDSTLRYFGLEHIESWTGKKLDGEITASEGTASSFSSGDVLFGKLRPYLAKAYLANEEGLISSEALVIRCKCEIRADFLTYYVLNRDFIKIVDSSTYGCKMPRASWDFIGNLPILRPDLEEQNAIVRFLDYKTTQIDALIQTMSGNGVIEQNNKSKSMVSLLQEYRSSLITNAVTGKIEVRNFVIPEPVERVAHVCHRAASA